VRLDAIVVGGGLFGQVIAKALRAQGRVVAVLDAHRSNAGSKPAACLMKPGWFAGLGRDVYEPSLNLLDRLYGVEDIEFKAALAKVTVHWVNPAKILSEPVSTMEVVRALPGRVEGRRETLEAPLIIVAAGVWSNELLRDVDHSVPALSGRAGVAFLQPEKRIEQPFIKPWAPYKQIVAFNRGDGLWVGDGNTIKPERWSDKRLQQSAERCEAAVGGIVGAEALYGIRPYADVAGPCALWEARPGLWVATGGAKNGTIAAGWCAHEIARRTS